MLKKVHVKDAIGLTLCQDLTKIIPGQYKGPGFRRGHIIKKDDIPELLNMGKEYIYVLELEEREVHEEEAALQIARALVGKGLEITKPREGRVNLKAKFSGLLKINIAALEKINLLGDIIVATLHNHTFCSTGQIVAGTRIIPLFTHVDLIHRVEKICRQAAPIIEVVSLPAKKVGVLIVGTELFEGRIKDVSGYIIQRKLEDLGSQVNARIIVPDDIEAIVKAMTRLRERKSEVIIASGGMSVDPDDVTYDAIKEVATEIVSYGVPTLPGSMLLYGLWDEIPILGIPACVAYDSYTSFDLFLPRVLAGEKITREEIAKLGHGGLCLKCRECRFPVCPYGKGF